MRGSSGAWGSKPGRKEPYRYAKTAAPEHGEKFPLPDARDVVAATLGPPPNAHLDADPLRPASEYIGSRLAAAIGQPYHGGEARQRSSNATRCWVKPLNPIHALIPQFTRASSKVRVVAKRRWRAVLGHIKSVILHVKSSAGLLAARTARAVQRRFALFYRRANLVRSGLRRRMIAHRRITIIVTLAILIIVSAIFVLPLQHVTESYFSGDRLSLLRNLLATTGGALIGATAIGFSVVMIAVQLNFARMPHGLFRKLSSDFRLLGAFATTFILAIGVAAMSLMPDASWSALALLVATWSTVLILVLFLYGYGRALDLINPLVQLHVVVVSAQKDMRAWERGARRMASLLELPDQGERTNPSRSTHDTSRAAFFQANPQWTAVSSQAIRRTISFARRYAEQGDYEVSSSALTAVLAINASYINAKGRTFFAHHPVFDIPQATDGFISETLEQLRQLAHVATTRGDEEQIRQVLATIAGPVRIYITIDYASEYVHTQEHAQLAASYLTGAVEAVLPRDMPDVLMEGVRLMGQSAQRFLTASTPNDILILAEKIGAISCTGAIKQEFRPVTLTGMEQLARLTFDLIRTKAHDIHFALGQLRAAVELVVQVFLNVPDAPLTNTHSTFLAPYYSLSKTGTLGEWLTDLANALVELDEEDKNARAVIRNINTWARELPQTQKKLLLLAIEKKSQFTFDVIHWIVHVTKLLDSVADAPAADRHTTNELEKDAIWLISVLSWIPDDTETVRFVENVGFTELLFEAGLDAISRGSYDVADTVRTILISWAFKGGRHETSQAILERSLLALAALVLWKDKLGLVPWLKAELAKRLAKHDAPDQEIRDRAAQGLRQHAAAIHGREFELSRINHAITQIDPAKLRPLLNEVADLLYP